MSWRQQKIDTLHEKANYAYFVGGGDIVELPAQMPADQANQNIYRGFDQRGNMPRYPSELYTPHEGKGRKPFSLWNDWETLIYFAPILNNQRFPQANNLASVIYGRQNDAGKPLPNSDVMVREVPVPRYAPGYPLGRALVMPAATQLAEPQAYPYPVKFL